jgi:uncharacterized protein YdeI (YjbR/CyaY-like superfamily)
MRMSLTFTPASREEWRAWLQQHHAAETEVWLVYFKPGPGQPTITYEDSVEEALCFGWIDSIIQKIDEQKYARKFNRRRPDSTWSASNRQRARRMIAAGRMTPAGLAAVEFPLDEYLDPPPPPRPDVNLPDFAASMLDENPPARQNYDNLAPSTRKRCLGWVLNAKQDATRLKRMTEVVAALKEGRPLGLK